MRAQPIHGRNNGGVCGESAAISQSVPYRITLKSDVKSGTRKCILFILSCPMRSHHGGPGSRRHSSSCEEWTSLATMSQHEKYPEPWIQQAFHSGARATLFCFRFFFAIFLYYNLLFIMINLLPTESFIFKKPQRSSFSIRIFCKKTFCNFPCIIGNFMKFFFSIIQC